MASAAAYPPVHPREEPVNRARRELLDFLIEWRKRNELTASEEFLLLSDKIGDLAAACVRGERKQRCGKKAKGE